MLRRRLGGFGCKLAFVPMLDYKAERAGCLVVEVEARSRPKPARGVGR